jgi:hypothetical protein
MRNAAPVLVISALAILLVVPPSLYFGAYYAMLAGRVQVGESTPDDNAIVMEDDSPSYRCESEAVDMFFSLANEVDKRLRPGAWAKARVEFFP